MEQRVKQRLIGAVILVALGVIFIPMLLQGPVERDRGDVPIEIPPRPRVTPVPDIPKADALYEPAPGQQLAENPPPVNAAITDTDAGVKMSSPMPAGKSSSPATVSKSAVSADSAGEGGRTAAAHGGNAADATPSAAWAVQVGSFQDRDNARALRQELQKSGFSTYVEQTRYERKPLFRVRVGPVAGRGEAEQLAARVHEVRGVEAMVVKK